MTRPIRVLVDARMLLGRYSGVARMVTSLVERLTELPRLRIIALCGNCPYQPWVGRDDIELILSDFSKDDRSAGRRFLWESFRLRGWILRSQANLFHATWNHGIPPRCPVPTVLTVHDLIPWHEHAATLSSRVQRTLYRRAVAGSIRRASKVVAVSRYSMQSIQNVGRCSASSIQVIYNGVEMPSQTIAFGSATTPYVLYVGGHEARKNVAGILHVMEQYWRTCDARMELHLTGVPGQLCSEARSAYERSGRDVRIRFLGTLSEEQLTREYSGATALLMLSRAEGFGLPVIEAFQCGCPVIASQCGSLPEIVSDTGVLVDPDDAPGICAAIHDIAATPGRREQLAAAGKRRATHFTWQRAADAYAAVYENALAETPFEERANAPKRSHLLFTRRTISLGPVRTLDRNDTPCHPVAAE